MLDATVYALLIAFPLVGLLTRRWLAIALPLIGWPIFYVGMNQGWWLYGTGDGWEAIARAITVIGVATTALAVAVARSLRPPTKPRRLRNEHRLHDGSTTAPDISRDD